MANSLLIKNSEEFWKEIDKLNNVDNVALSTNVIDGIEGQANIASLWRDKYSKVYNRGYADEHNRLAVHEWLDGYEYAQNSFDKVTDEEVMFRLHKLKVGKAMGADGLSAEMLKMYTSCSLKHLTLLCNTFSFKCIIPEDVLQVKLFPIPRNKFGDSNLSDNYRCIAVSSCFAKMVESIVLERLKGKTVISDHQLGFRERHSTDVCCDVIKKVVSHYRNNNSYVFLTFLDMSKAFDYVNYWKLFMRLLNEDVDDYLVRLITTWYSSEKMCVCWNNVCSESFGHSNGVRQGSPLSPFLNSY